MASAGSQTGTDVETFDPVDHRSYTLDCTDISSSIEIDYPELHTSAAPTVRLVVAGSADGVYVRFSARDASPPDGETPGDMFLPVGAIEVFPVRPDRDGVVTISAITGASAATLHISMGYGA